MKKTLLIIVFIIGLGIFSYPIISNHFSTKAQQTVVKEYREAIQEMDMTTIEQERKKADVHNEKLKSSQLDFVDPFSDEQTKSTGNKSYYNALNIGPAIGNLEIPKIDVQLPMFHGTNDGVLSRGVGHLENSSLPTGNTGTHSVLTAHRGLPSSKLFRDLDQLVIGDEFFIQVLDEIYAYQVFDIEIVLPHQTEWLQLNDDEEIVTLLTCEPYMVNTHRMLVKGKRVPYQPTKETPSKSDSIPLFVYILIGIVSLLLVVRLIHHRIKKARLNRDEI